MPLWDVVGMTDITDLTQLRRNVHEAEAQAQTAGRYAEQAQAAFYAAIEARERARAELRAALAERDGEAVA